MKNIYEITFPYVFTLKELVYSARTNAPEYLPEVRQNREYIKHKLEEIILSPLKGDLCLGVFYTKKSDKLPDADNVLGLIKDSGNKSCWVDDRQFKDVYVRSVSSANKTFTTILIAKQKLQKEVYQRLKEIRNKTIQQQKDQSKSR